VSTPTGHTRKAEPLTQRLTARANREKRHLLGMQGRGVRFASKFAVSKIWKDTKPLDKFEKTYIILDRLKY
jgi:hypothetical protein